MMTDLTLALLGGYFGLGVLFALGFVLGNGAGRIDPGARKATIGFHLIIIPGTVIFWPYLLWRWLTGQQPPEEHSRHRHPRN